MGAYFAQFSGVLLLDLEIENSLLYHANMRVAELGYPASVRWRRGIENAPRRLWPPVLILLVDQGERSPLQLTLGAKLSLIIAKFPYHWGDSPLV